MINTENSLIIIDSHALLHRAYHAFPPTLKTQKGEIVNAVYGFTSILLEVISKFKPKYLVCAFDSKGPTIRHTTYVDYKANRGPADDDFIVQIPVVKKVLEVFQIPIFAAPGFEADDIIGTLVKDKEIKDMNKLVVTGDQDIFQLIDEKTNVYISGSKFSEAKIYDAEEVKKKFGFGPDFIVDYKAIRGDTSDNIPGVKGIGEKGAKDLIMQFGHLKSIYENINMIKSESLKKKLVEGIELAELSRELATIITDVPLTFKIEDAKLEAYNQEDVKELFMELGFRSLMNRIPKSDSTTPRKQDIQPSLFGSLTKNEEIGKAKQVSRTTSYSLIQSESDIDNFINLLAKQEIFAFDTETTGLDNMNDKAIGISFSWKKDEAYFVDLNGINADQISKLKAVFENEKVRKVGHNIKFDTHILANSSINRLKLGFETKGIYFDTMIAAYDIYGGQGSFGLKNLGFTELGIVMNNLEDLWGNVSPKSRAEAKNLMLSIEVAKLSEYACADADVTWQLYEKYERALLAN